ncbi:MAG: AMP-binding protein [Vicinamibacterales bacterium]
MSLVEMFVRAAKQNPAKVAIVDRASSQRITYKTALTRTLALSSAFNKFEPGFTGVMLPTSAAAILTVVATVMSGRTPVMINYSTGAADNCRMAQRRLRFRTIITSRLVLEKLKCPLVEGMVFLEDVAAGLSRAAKLSAFVRAAMPAGRVVASLYPTAPGDNIVVLFTSGSERDPKAVPLSDRNIGSNIEGMHGVLEFGPKDIILGNLPLFHVFGMNTNCWLPLTNAMTVVTFPNPLEFRSICSAIREERITMVVGTPTFLAGYLQKSEPGDFETVRLLITGADKCPESLRRGFLENHGKVLLEGYGTTETSPVISVNSPDHNRPGSVGRVLPNLQVRMEHYETGETSAVNEIGKILVKGESVMSGYYDDFEATALHMRHGWYDTADMGYMDADGYLWHVGRLGRFLKIGGEMVSLVQVEDALARALPEGVEGAVVEVPDGVRGGRIVAALTARVDEKHLNDALAGVLPRIALPRQYVVVEELPKMPSGKTDYRSLTDVVLDTIGDRRPGLRDRLGRGEGRSKKV